MTFHVFVLLAGPHHHHHKSLLEKGPWPLGFAAKLHTGRFCGSEQPAPASNGK